jgi:hypothetical protein
MNPTELKTHTKTLDSRVQVQLLEPSLSVHSRLFGTKPPLHDREVYRYCTAGLGYLEVSVDCPCKSPPWAVGLLVIVCTVHP